MSGFKAQINGQLSLLDGFPKDIGVLGQSACQVLDGLSQSVSVWAEEFTDFSISSKEALSMLQKLGEEAAEFKKNVTFDLPSGNSQVL